MFLFLGLTWRETKVERTERERSEREMEMEKEKAAASSSEAAELPKAIVRRIVKDKLSRCSEEDMNIHKDALTAFSESARIFIHYLSAT